MGLYKLFSSNVEIQYKSGFLSMAMFFTVVTSLLNIILPFFIAYRSRGFWLRTHYFYEQPVVKFTYDYIIIAQTDDPSLPIVCSSYVFNEKEADDEEYCAETEVFQHDKRKEGKTDVLEFKVKLNVPPLKIISSITLILALDVQLRTICPLQMQSLAIINRDLSVPATSLKVYGTLDLYQTMHLPCLRNYVDTKYNHSILKELEKTDFFMDNLIEEYFNREITTNVKTFHSIVQNGHTGIFNIKTSIKVPEVKVRYTPSILQELKWAWPQYLSIVVIFYWIFDRIKKFVFNNRLVMAWKVSPIKKIKS